MTAAILKEFMPYGAPDLQEAARPHMVRALALGSLIASLCFALAWSLSLLFGAPSAPISTVIAHYEVQDVHVLQPPPPMTPPPPRVAVARPTTAAIPVVVPDEVAPKETSIPNQSELSSTIGEEKRTAEITPVIPVVSEEPVNDPGTVPFVDELPVAVKQVEPPYPSLAHQAGVEGLVIVNVLVGKDGRVLDAKLHPKVNIVLLNEASLEAAKQWVFTPAIDHGRPVSVWVTIPFHYRLY